MWSEYYIATSIEDVLEKLAKYEGKARIIAGGTDLVIDVNKDKYNPQCVVDTTRIPGLDVIEEDGNYITVGANTTFHKIWTSTLVNKYGPVLAEAAKRVAAWSVQNVGTLAGNVVTAQPAGDGSIALVALDAEAEIAGPEGRNWKSVATLYAGPGRSNLDPTKEMLTRFRWRKPEPNQISVYERIAKREVMSLPIACCGVDLKLSEDKKNIEWVRIALGPVAETPFRATAAEELLRNASCNESNYERAADQAIFDCVFRTSRLRATKEYRRKAVKVLIKRALIRAVEGIIKDEVPNATGRFKWDHIWSNKSATDYKNDKVTFLLNGKEKFVEVKPNTMLVHLLREELGLTGTKIGCNEGECGACTVLVDNQPVVSCLYPAVKIHGRSVQTIEGVARNGNLHPVQDAFIHHDAVQCGYCTPGMVLASISLLEGIPNPSTEEIKIGLGNNYCRCTGYAKIVEAVNDAAAVLRGEQKEVIRKTKPRKDAIAKVTGAEIYAGDMKPENLLIGKIVWSEHPHAEILSIDTTEAKTVPGVVKVITHVDIPGENIFGSMGYDQPVLAENKVLYVGEAVAVVYAENQEAAEEGARKVKVEYLLLPGVFTPQEAMRPDAPILKGDDNIFHRTLVEKGDIKAGFKQADVIVEEDYKTQTVEHGFLETEGGIAMMEGDCLAVYQATQWPPGDRAQLADILGISEESIRMVATPMGGGFGGKMDMTTQPFLALGTYLTGRPVKIVLDRFESLRMDVKRHPYWMHYKIGAKLDGKIVAMEAKLVADGGAYRSSSNDVLEQSSVFSSGPYEIPNVKVNGISVRTNNVTRGAMRGFGAQQVTFAMELHMDLLAKKLGIDPFELRHINMYDVGSTLVTGQVLTHSVGAKPVIEAAEKRLKALKLPEPQSGKQIGVGMAVGMKNVGIGLANDESVYVSLELQDDGTILLRQGAIDMGQGSNSVMCEIASRTIGCDYDIVEQISGDTKEGMDGGITAASRQTHITGQAVFEVSNIFKDKLLKYAANIYKTDEKQIKIIKNGLLVDTADETQIGNLKELADYANNEKESLRVVHHYIPQQTYRILSPQQQKAEGIDPESYINYPAFCYGCQIAIVEIDTETGQVDVLKVIAAHDIGTAIRPASVEGQIEGGVSMGIGYALTEEFVEENGVILTDSLYKLTLPRSTNPVTIEPIIVEDPHPKGPYGGKGIGEGAYMPTAPAIVNAINNVLGTHIKSIPVSRDTIVAALEGNNGDKQ